ncbi:MAG: hypothetical protein R3D55_05770 [Chloroflexota bacterium]
MATVLQALVQDEAKLAELAQKGVAQAATFSWAGTAVATLTQYRQLHEATTDSIKD